MVTEPADAPGLGALIDLRSVARLYPASEGSGLCEATLSIDSGEFVAIVGSSGAGKSTLLNVLGLIDRPTSGSYFLDGKDVSGLRERERDRLRSEYFGFVFQAAYVLDDESSLRNAALGLRIRSTPMALRAERAQEALATVGIGGKSATRAGLLSGGERQRLAMARTVAIRPRIILADEPTGNLDSANAREIMALLRRLNADGATVVMITHDRALAGQADRQITITDGRTRSGDPAGSQASSGPWSREQRAGHAMSAGPAGRAGSAERIADDLGDTLTAMVHRLPRTLMLVLAFALGVGGLVASFGMSATAAAQVDERLTRAERNEVRVNPRDSSRLLATGDTRLARWCDRARRLPHVVACGHVAQVGAASAIIGRLDPGDTASDTEVRLMNASPSYLRMYGVTTVGPQAAQATQTIGLLADGNAPGIALVGSNALRQIGVAGPGPGSTVWVNGRRVDVVGELRPSARLPQIAQSIVVSRDVPAGLPSVAVSLVVRTDPGYSASVAEALPLQLDPAKPTRFSVETVGDLRHIRRGIATDLGTYVAVLSAILFALAAFSAAATMHLSVQSRAPEIALRRALGSSRFSIARLFLLEGASVGTVGGAIGSAIGTAATLADASARGWSPALPAQAIPLGMLLGVGVGLLSALVPAWAASRREPAIAIRG